MSRSAFQYLGLALAVLAAVGYFVFGWRFDGAGSTLPAGLGAVVAAIAVAAVLLKLTGR